MLSEICANRGCRLVKSAFRTVLTPESTAHCYDLLTTDFEEIVKEAAKVDCHEKKQAEAEVQRKKRMRTSVSSSVAPPAPSPAAPPAAASSSSSSGPVSAEPASFMCDALVAVPAPELSSARSSLPAPVRPSAGAIHTVQEARLLCPPGAQVQLNRGKGWTVKLPGRVSEGQRSKTHAWGPNTLYSSEEALGLSLEWAWSVHVLDGGAPPPFDLAEMLPPR